MYWAGVDNGVNLELNLAGAKGNVAVFESDNQLNIRYSISVGLGFFSKEYNDEAKLFDIRGVGMRVTASLLGLGIDVDKNERRCICSPFT